MTSKFWLLAAVPALLAADEPPLCESYTPGQLCLCDGWGVSLIGEGLYWTTREHHLIITTANAGFDPTDQVPPNLGRWDFQGDMLRIEPSWDYGWRAGIGFTSSCDYWDLFSYWTSFRTNQSEDIELVDLPGLNLWGYPDTFNGALLFSASASWDLTYDIFDAEFGRAFWIGRCLVFRPHFGVRAAWIDQKLDFHFDYQPQGGIPFGALKHLTCDFTGAGLRSGFDLNFTNGTGFGLYGKISLALLYGTFQSDFSETETGAFLIADAKDRFQMGVVGFQGTLGINWNRCFCCDRFRLGLHAQWEFNLWNDVNKFNHYSTEFSNGIFRQENTSLSLMGFTFGGGVDF